MNNVVPQNPPSIAFFDVDETLISIKSMFDFYEYFLQSIGHSSAERRRLYDEARALVRPGLPREQGNRLFYRRFAGYKVDEVAALGQRWFDAWIARGNLFHADVVRELQAHRQAGVRTVLLSGSFSACLDPVRAHCGADQSFSTGLKVLDGVYTGEVTRTMIGDAKADIARGLIGQAGILAADCHAYGDHVSDLGLLRLVGHPAIVGGHPDVLAAAEPHWLRLAGTAG